MKKLVTTTKITPLVNPAFEQPCQVFRSSPTKVKKTLRQLAKAEAGKLIAWWAMGFPAVDMSAYKVDKDGNLVRGDLLWKPADDCDGEMSVLAMTGYAALLDGKVTVKDFCKFRLDQAIARLSYGSGKICLEEVGQDDFDQVIYTGIELLGKANRIKGVVENLRDALPLTAEEYETILWVCEAYYLLGCRICESCEREIKVVTKLLLEKPSLNRDEMTGLFCNELAEQDPEIDFELESVEEEIGPCPLKNLDRSKFDDLVGYRVSIYPGYAPLA